MVGSPVGTTGAGTGGDGTDGVTTGRDACGAATSLQAASTGAVIPSAAHTMIRYRVDMNVCVPFNKPEGLGISGMCSPGLEVHRSKMEVRHPVELSFSSDLPQSLQ